MPFLFIVTGLVMVISAARNTYPQLLQLLKDDVTGQNNFVYWMAAILGIGALGYIPDLKPVSRAFLVLVVIVLILKNGGVFNQFVSALNTTQAANPSIGTSATSSQPGPSQSGSQNSIIQQGLNYGESQAGSLLQEI
jgi:hypothetical protein